MSKNTIEADTIAWMPSYESADRLRRTIASGNANDIVDMLAFSRMESMGEGKDPWLRVGAARITVELIAEDAIVVNAVKNLRAEQQRVRASAEIKAQEIEQAIQNMLAIGHDAPAPAARLDDDFPF